MCLAIPGKVLSINGRSVRVKYPSEERDVLNGDINISIGDFVMVQMGIIIKKLSPEQAKISLEAWKSVAS